MSRDLDLVRSAVLADFDNLVRELGGAPRSMYRSAGLTATLMSNPYHMVPCANVSTLLEVAARTLELIDAAGGKDVRTLRKEQ